MEKDASCNPTIREKETTDALVSDITILLLHSAGFLPNNEGAFKFVFIFRQFSLFGQQVLLIKSVKFLAPIIKSWDKYFFQGGLPYNKQFPVLVRGG